jgi:hypothetical protein
MLQVSFKHACVLAEPKSVRSEPSGGSSHGDGRGGGRGGGRGSNRGGGRDPSGRKKKRGRTSSSSSDEDARKHGKGGPSHAGLTNSDVFEVMRAAAEAAGVVPSSIRLRYPVVFGARLRGRELRQVSVRTSPELGSMKLCWLGSCSASQCFSS